MVWLQELLLHLQAWFNVVKFYRKNYFHRCFEWKYMSHYLRWLLRNDSWHVVVFFFFFQFSKCWKVSWTFNYRREQCRWPGLRKSTHHTGWEMCCVMFRRCEWTRARTGSPSAALTSANPNYRLWSVSARHAFRARLSTARQRNRKACCSIRGQVREIFYMQAAGEHTSQKCCEAADSQRRNPCREAELGHREEEWWLCPGIGREGELGEGWLVVVVIKLVHCLDFRICWICAFPCH